MTWESINYETLKRITDAISSTDDLSDATEHAVHTLTDALKIKGCALMLLDRSTQELKLAAAHGLSQTYLEKGPVSASKSIAASLSDGPVAIYDVEDDPRLQYPQEAKKEGIKSILSFPLVLRGKTLGVLRLYSADPWEVDIQDMAVIQAIALIIALTIDNLRMHKGFQTSIDVLRVMQQAKKPTRRTLYE